MSLRALMKTAAAALCAVMWAASPGALHAQPVFAGAPTPATPTTPTSAVRSGDVLSAEDWARLRGSGLTSPGAQGAEIFGTSRRRRSS